MKKTLLPLFAISALGAISANAAILSIDFGTGTSPVEPGFIAQTTGTA